MRAPKTLDDEGGLEGALKNEYNALVSMPLLWLVRHSLVPSAPISLLYRSYFWPQIEQHFKLKTHLLQIASHFK